MSTKEGVSLLELDDKALAVRFEEAFTSLQSTHLEALRILIEPDVYDRVVALKEIREQVESCFGQDDTIDAFETDNVEPLSPLDDDEQAYQDGDLALRNAYQIETGLEINFSNLSITTQMSPDGSPYFKKTYFRSDDRIVYRFPLHDDEWIKTFSSERALPAGRKEVRGLIQTLERVTRKNEVAIKTANEIK